MAKAGSMQWYGHVLRKDENVMVKALKFEVRNSIESGRSTRTWRQVEDEIKTKKKDW